MPDVLPIFPLQLVVFPGEQVNLHIFEPRYKQLIRDCEEAGATFVIPPFIRGKLMHLGTEVGLVDITKRYDNGEMDITVEGKGIVSLSNITNPLPAKLYSGAGIRPFEVELNENPDTNNRILKLLYMLFFILKIDKPLPAKEHPSLSYAIGHLVGFSIEKEFHLLSLHSGLDRQAYILEHLGKLVPHVREMEEMKHRVQMNGHYRHLNPPNF